VLLSFGFALQAFGVLRPVWFGAAAPSFWGTKTLSLENQGAYGFGIFGIVGVSLQIPMIMHCSEFRKDQWLL